MNHRSQVEPVPKHDLDIDEKLNDHILGWKVQTIGMAFIFLVVFSAAAGLFGDGVLSKKTISSPAGTVEYDQFTRFESRMPLKVEVASTSPDKSVVSFSNSYLDKFRVETIVPEPSEVSVREEKIHYAFKNAGAFKVVFYLIPQQFGPIEGDLQVDGHTIKIDQFIFP